MKSILVILLCIPYGVLSQPDFTFKYRIELKPQISTYTLKKVKCCDTNSIRIIVRSKEGDVNPITLEINRTNGERIITSSFEATVIQKLNGGNNYTIKVSSQGYTTLIIDSLLLSQCMELKVLLGNDNAFSLGHIISKHALSAMEIEHIIDELSKGNYPCYKKSKKKNGYFVRWEM